MTFLDALKLRMGDRSGKLFSDADYADFIVMIGGHDTLAYDGSNTAHIKQLELAERETLQAILNNPDDTRYNSFKEGAYGKTLDVNAIRRRIEEITAKYRLSGRTRMQSL